MREITPFHKLRNNRIKAFYIVLAVVFVYLTCGLFYRQVIQKKYFEKKQDRQSLRRIVIPGTRGNIYDRNGILLAGSKRQFVINLDLCELAKEVREKYLSAIKFNVENGIRFKYKDLKRSIGEGVLEKYIDDINQKIGTDISISYEEIEQHITRNFLLPMRILNNISQKNYEILLTTLPKDSPIQVSIENVRYYPYNDLLCHVLGYVSFEQNCDDPSLDGKKVRSFVEKRQSGKTGIELAKDYVLHGKPGYELWRVGPSGRASELIESEQPQTGSSVILSIDKNLQTVTEKALGSNRGCCVVLNIKTGEILSLASRPAYDINSVVPRISNEVYEKITSQGAWLNLVTQGRFPPGSIFKLASSIAFLKSGKVLSTDSVFCSGTTKIGNRNFHCKNHQLGIKISFGDAIARSCNTFFYENSIKVKKEQIIRTATDLGLSQKTGIELPYEVNGFIPTETWKRSKKSEGWMLGDTVNLSIGQGYLLVTPMEICCMTAAIATNSERVHPTIFLNGNIGRSHLSGTLGLTDEDYKFLINSMVDTVENRSGRRAKIENLKIAGKTGTAQFFENGEKRNLAWFTCFAPVDDPEIAVTVMVQEKNKEDSFWGSVNAAPIAKEILNEYFSKK